MLKMAYYFAIVACGMMGAKKSFQKSEFLYLPASFLAALGGGMFRDLLVLHVFPAAFTTDCIPDITVALCSGIAYHMLSQKRALQNFFEDFIVLADALGLGTFVFMGIDRSYAFGASPFTAFCCGIITALGGGVLSSLLCGQSIHNVLTVDITYRLITCSSAFLYTYFRAKDINQITAQYIIVLYTYASVLFLNHNHIPKLVKIYTPPHSLEIVTPIPFAAINYQLFGTNHSNRSHKSLPPHFANASGRAWDRNLLCTTYRTSLKSLCPARFSRGR